MNFHFFKCTNKILLFISCFSMILIIAMINEMSNIYHLEIQQQDSVPARKHQIFSTPLRKIVDKKSLNSLSSKIINYAFPSVVAIYWVNLLWNGTHWIFSLSSQNRGNNLIGFRPKIVAPCSAWFDQKQSFILTKRNHHQNRHQI